jgi:peroxiredoxin
MAALNAPAPDFSLPDPSGAAHRLGDLRGRIVLLCMWSARCPWSRRIDRALSAWPAELTSAVDLLRLAVNAGEPPAELSAGLPAEFPGTLLLDSERAVADRYGARVTPEFFLIDRAGLLRYRGAFDDATFRVRVPQRFHLAAAVRALLAGEAPDPAETPAYGCAIERWNA